MPAMSVTPMSFLTDYDVFLIKQGRFCDLHSKLGARAAVDEFGRSGVYFGVWAPNARGVYVCGSFNGWDGTSCPLFLRGDDSGIWEGFVPFARVGDVYKYNVVSCDGEAFLKADPLAFMSEGAPGNGSVVWDSGYVWQDGDWMDEVKGRDVLREPLCIYEMHLGSWRRHADGRMYSYSEVAEVLPSYLREMGFNAVEFLPLMEHPFYGSWGYQATGFFCPTSRYGTPDELKFLIDRLHEAGIFVILDWAPSHFPADSYGLARFDGTALYEYSDSREGWHNDWQSFIFNYRRHEVRNFLFSSACYWLSEFHFDGLRVDAVASMLYRDYSRGDGQWIANEYGGRENLEAVAFLRDLNCFLYERFPRIETIAEESTAWPGVTKPVHYGGLGFGMKWNMGWMHDVLGYMSSDPLWRNFEHDKITFSVMYAFYENFVLPLSHDEVVHEKGSLFGKMFGSRDDKLASLRVLYGYMYGHPGKKLLFMGSELGQVREWSHDRELDWFLLAQRGHEGISRWVRDLNFLMRSNGALYSQDFSNQGFEWMDCSDRSQSVVSWVRYDLGGTDPVLVVCNFTPVARYDYLVGVPAGGRWAEVLNSDASCYGGSGMGNLGGVDAQGRNWHGKEFCLSLTLPPLSVLFLRPEGL